DHRNERGAGHADDAQRWEYQEKDTSMFHRSLRAASVSAVLAATILFNAGPTGPAATPVQATPLPAYDGEARAFLTLINQSRAGNGLPALALDAKLQSAAAWMSQDFLTRCVDPHHGDFAGDSNCVGANAHVDSQGRNADPRIKAFGYQPTGAWSDGENIF